MQRTAHRDRSRSRRCRHPLLGAASACEQADGQHGNDKGHEMSPAKTTSLAHHRTPMSSLERTRCRHSKIRLLAKTCRADPPPDSSSLPRRSLWRPVDEPHTTASRKPSRLLPGNGEPPVPGSQRSPQSKTYCTCTYLPAVVDRIHRSIRRKSAGRSKKIRRARILFSYFPLFSIRKRCTGGKRGGKAGAIITGNKIPIGNGDQCGSNR